MGGGDLNMKKSWHPLLHTNQERVWKQEKKAYEERKKLDELKRERDQEREMQELQRLQEEAGGKKRVDKVDWMYAAPSTGNGPSAGELEDYLLGKKGVDQYLNKKAKESNQKDLASGPGTGGKDSFMALQQNANSAGDLAAKIREDPMFAIKQQEQAAYQMLLKDPTRLKQLRAAAGLAEEDDKEARRRRKEEKRRRRAREEEDMARDRHHRGSGSGSGRHRDESPSPREDRDHRRHSGQRRDYPVERSRPRGSSSRNRSPEHDRERVYGRGDYDDRDQHSRRSNADSRYDDRSHQSSGRDARHRRSDGGSRSPERRSRERRYENRHDGRDRSPPSRRTALPAVPRRENQAADVSNGPDAARAAALARMQSNAASLNSERTAYLDRVKQEEEEELRREESTRLRRQAQAGGRSVQGGAAAATAGFLSQQRSQGLMDGDLEHRLKRTARGGLQKFDSAD
ncbi:unnamed protein product [Parajaminaea phylloscopi]